VDKKLFYSLTESPFRVSFQKSDWRYFRVQF
jgi:hypothetical protein